MLTVNRPGSRREIREAHLGHLAILTGADEGNLNGTPAASGLPAARELADGDYETSRESGCSPTITFRAASIES